MKVIGQWMKIVVAALIFSFAFQFNVSAESGTTVLTLTDKGLQSGLNRLVQVQAVTQQEVNELTKPDATFAKLMKRYEDIDLVTKESVVYSLDPATGQAKELLAVEGSSYDKNSPSELQAAANSSVLVYRVDFFYFVADASINKPKFVQAGVVTSVTGSGQKPTNYTLILKNQTSDTRYGVYSDHAVNDTNKKVKLKEEVVLESPITRTWYWKGTSAAFANFPDHSYRAKEQASDPLFLNKKGVKYPEYKDPQSGIVLWEPPANLPVNQRTPGSTYRDDFIKYYEKNWGKPTKFKWDDVQIHHMKPAKYNGQDSVSNLIPLWKPGSTAKNGIMNHSEITTWWASY